MPNNNAEQREKLLKLVRDAVEQDKMLREQYQIGDKFRFIRDRLHALLARIEESVAISQKESEIKADKLAEDEELVYVYLYNAQGLALQSWQKMLNPAVFYEYSVNRPIYTDRSAIDAFIRSKTNKAQHGYITVAVKKSNILKIQDASLKDPIGNPLVKVKEGSLSPGRMFAFTHNGQNYILDEEGKIVPKPV
ncbi:type IVB secretion system protein IcmQ [Aquicella lusitana]|nr:type IVB secretion system protein IcmQ [Aquicella lusitana]